MKTTTTHWVIEQLLTHEELHSPEDTPAQWWQVPGSREYELVDQACNAADRWRGQHPERRVRVVEVVTQRTAYERGADAWFRAQT